MSMIGCIAGIPIDLNKSIISIFSFSISIISLLILRNRKLSITSKLYLVYIHLSTLIFPLILFTINVGCGAFCLACYNNIFSLIVYSIPTTLIFSTLASFILAPIYYIYTSSKELENSSIIKFVKRYSKVLKINPPKIYILDKSKPLAFSIISFKPAIFLTVGLFDILKMDEIKAVLLHELYHIASKSSFLKFSTYILRFFSPLYFIVNLSHSSEKEERKADNFVIKTQKTRKYLISAKMKIKKFNILS